MLYQIYCTRLLCQLFHFPESLEGQTGVFWSGLLKSVKFLSAETTLGKDQINAINTVHPISAIKYKIDSQKALIYIFYESFRISYLRSDYLRDWVCKEVCKTVGLLGWDPSTLGFASLSEFNARRVLFQQSRKGEEALYQQIKGLGGA